ncbi:Os01g0806801, partial [Oryza sativa Japonica Group]
QFSSGLITISHMFKNWLVGVDKKNSKLILVGASAICWAI